MPSKTAIELHRQASQVMADARRHRQRTVEILQGHLEEDDVWSVLSSPDPSDTPPGDSPVVAELSELRPGIRGVVSGLQELAREIENEKRDADRCLIDRDAAIERYREAYTGLKDLLTGLYVLGGQRELARRLRAAVSRRNRSSSDAEPGPPEDLPLPDLPLPDGPVPDPSNEDAPFPTEPEPVPDEPAEDATPAA